MLLVSEAEYRDFLAFREAKKRKRERIKITARGGAAASYRPSSARGFQNFRGALRGVGDWGQASERVDALEDALRRRHVVGLPLPRKVLQNEDRSLTLFWEGVCVRLLPDGVSWRVGGVAGVAVLHVNNELLDLLAFQAKIQRAS